MINPKHRPNYKVNLGSFFTTNTYDTKEPFQMGIYDDLGHIQNLLQYEIPNYLDEVFKRLEDIEDKLSKILYPKTQLAQDMTSNREDIRLLADEIIEVKKELHEGLLNDKQKDNG